METEKAGTLVNNEDQPRYGAPQDPSVASYQSPQSFEISHLVLGSDIAPYTHTCIKINNH